MTIAYKKVTKRKWSDLKGQELQPTDVSLAGCLHLCPQLVPLPGTGIISIVPWAVLRGPHPIKWDSMLLIPDSCQWPLWFLCTSSLPGQGQAARPAQLRQVTANCRKPALPCLISLACRTGYNLLKWQLIRSYFSLRQLMNSQLSVSVILK